MFWLVSFFLHPLQSQSQHRPRILKNNNKLYKLFSIEIYSCCSIEVILNQTMSYSLWVKTVSSLHVPKVRRNNIHKITIFGCNCQFVEYIIVFSSSLPITWTIFQHIFQIFVSNQWLEVALTSFDGFYYKLFFFTHFHFSTVFIWVDEKYSKILQKLLHA